jgi:two-component system nitrate/nitrite response regulator NarL
MLMSINRLPQLQRLPKPDDRHLTPREYTIAALASAGLSNKEIARRLELAEGTVKIHLHHVYRKTRVRNRTALVALIDGYPLRQTG